MSYTASESLKDPEVVREFREIGKEMENLRRMQVRFSEPQRPRDGFFCICDGSNWNPLGDGIKRPVWFDETAGLWKAF